MQNQYFRALMLILLFTPTINSHATKLEPSLQKGHTAAILALATTQDGKYAATGGSGRVIKLWELATGRELHTLEGHSGVITDIEISPDNRYILSAEGLGKQIYIWNLNTGTLLKKITASGEQFAIANHDNHLFSGDGQLINIDTNQIIRTFNPSHKISAVAFSPDDRHIAIGYNQGTVQIISASTGKTLATFQHTKTITAVQFSPNGRQLLSTSYAGDASIWNLTNKQRIHHVHHHNKKDKPNEILDAIFSHNGDYFFTAGRNKQVIRWNSTTGKQEKVIESPYVIDKIALQQKPNYIISVSRDIAIDQWHPITGRLMRSLQEKSSKEKKILIDKTGQWAFTISNRNNIAIWNLEHGLLEWRWNAQVGEITDITLSSNNQWIVVSGEAKKITVWDYIAGSQHEQFRPAQPFLTHNAPITSASFVKQDRFIISIAGDGGISVWDGQKHRQVDTHSVGEPLISMAISPAGDVLATGGYQGSVHIWDISDNGKLSNRLALKHKQGVTQLHFSPDGQQLHTVSNKIRTIDLSTRKLIKPSIVAKGPQHLIATSPDQKYLAVGAARALGLQ